MLCGIVLCMQLSVALEKTSSSVSRLESLNTEKHDARWLRYEEEKKEPWIAVGAAWFIPSVGHAYAGDWGRGFPFLLADIACIGLAATGIQQKSTTTDLGPPYGSYTTKTTEYTSTYYAGLGLLVLARIWEYFDVYALAEQHNKNLQQELMLSDEEMSTHQGN